eukprot:745421-Rhodomonas_salina.1
MRPGPRPPRPMLSSSDTCAVPLRVTKSRAVKSNATKSHAVKSHSVQYLYRNSRQAKYFSSAVRRLRVLFCAFLCSISERDLDVRERQLPVGVAYVP